MSTNTTAATSADTVPAAANGADRKVVDALEARLLTIDGTFKHSNGAAMALLRGIFARAGRDAVAILRSAGKFDYGRAIHMADLLQQAKDTACVSLLLPYAEPTPSPSST